MSVEIAFPIEFLVKGTPVSLNAKRAQSRSAWQACVREASRCALPEGHFAASGPIAVTLLYFPDGKMQGDVDNIVKPVLDALCRHVYHDDRQVERVWVQKFEHGAVVPFGNPTATLAGALIGARPLLFVRLSTEPNKVF